MSCNKRRSKKRRNKKRRSKKSRGRGRWVIKKAKKNRAVQKQTILTTKKQRFEAFSASRVVPPTRAHTHTHTHTHTQEVKR